MPVVELSTIATEPVGVDEVKTHLRIDSTSEDSYLRDFLIPTARRQCEAFARKAFISRSFREDIPGYRWPSYGAVGVGPVVLERTPLQSVTSIAYYASGSTTLSTWTASNYLVDTAKVPGGVYLAPGGTWLAPSDTRHDAVQITYVAGYSSLAESVPADYRHAVLLWCAHLHEHRGDEAREVDPPRAIKDLIRPTRNFTFK